MSGQPTITGHMNEASNMKERDHRMQEKTSLKIQMNKIL